MNETAGVQERNGLATVKGMNGPPEIRNSGRSYTKQRTSVAAVTKSNGGVIQSFRACHALPTQTGRVALDTTAADLISGGESIFPGSPTSVLGEQETRAAVARSSALRVTAPTHFTPAALYKSPARSAPDATSVHRVPERTQS